MVDVDDVIYPFSSHAHALLEQAGITNGRPLTSWDFDKSYGSPRGTAWRILTSHQVSGKLFEALPIPGALAQLARLRYHGARIHLVTARGTFGSPQDALTQALTRQWVLGHNVPLDTLAFEADKVAYGEQFGGFDYVLDDKPSTIQAFYAQTTAMPFLMNACHNQDALMPRVRTVREFADYVLNAELGAEAVEEAVA